MIRIGGDMKNRSNVIVKPCIELWLTRKYIGDALYLQLS